MGTTTIDLWPKDLGPVERTPVAILKEQASLLGRHTGNLVLGEVRPRRPIDGDGQPDLIVEFRLVAPALDNYAYVLFSLSHKLHRQYPMVVLGAPGSVGLEPTLKGPKKIADENQLVDFMRAVFSLPETLSVINNLMAQSKLEDRGYATA